MSYRQIDARDPDLALALRRLVKAALEQPRPTKRLAGELNVILRCIGHPLMLRREEDGDLAA